MAIQADPREEIFENQAGEIDAGWVEGHFQNIGDEPLEVNGDILEPYEGKTYGFVGKPYRTLNYDATNSKLRTLLIY